MITLATVSFYIRDKQQEDLEETAAINDDEEEDDDVGTHTTITEDSVAKTKTTSQQPSPTKSMKIVVPKWIQYIHNRIENSIQKLTSVLEEAL